MVIAEHGAFSIKFLIKFVSPVIPDWIEDAREYLQIRSESDLKLPPGLEIPPPQLVAMPPLPKPAPRARGTVSNPVAKMSDGPLSSFAPTKSAAQEEAEEEDKLQAVWMMVTICI